MIDPKHVFYLQDLAGSDGACIYCSEDEAESHIGGRPYRKLTELECEELKELKKIKDQRIERVHILHTGPNRAERRKQAALKRNK